MGEREGSDRASAVLDAIEAIATDADIQVVLSQLISAVVPLTQASSGLLRVEQHLGAERRSYWWPADADPSGADPSGAEPADAEPTDAHPLVIPVRATGRDVGSLRLVRGDGSDFTMDEERVARTFARAAGFVVSVARDLARSERRQRWLEASAALSTLLHDTATVEEAMRLVAHHVWVTTGARAVGVVHLEYGTDGAAGGPELHVVGMAGAGEEELAALALALAPDVVMVGSELRVRATSAPAGEGILLVPMPAEVAAGGVLLVAYGVPRGKLDPEEAGMLASFAEQVSLVLDRAQAIGDRQELVLMGDRERIARDLHDRVIQRIFATGLQLEGVRRASDSEDVRSRLAVAAAELDHTISEVRATIFKLQRPRPQSVRARVSAVVEEYAGVLDFSPTLVLEGPIDAVVTTEVAEHLLAVLREALSNVARHARAQRCRVTVRVDATRVVLVVVDDGVGAARVRDESGLHNARRRARELGGALEVTAQGAGGTRLRWAVPIPEAPEAAGP